MNKKMERVSAATQTIPVLSQIAASLWSTPIKLIGGGLGLVDVAGQNIRNAITGENKPIDYNTDAMVYSKAASTIRKTVAQDILDATGSIDLNEEDHPILSRLLNGKSLADVYQFGMGVLDSTAVVALAAINPAFGKAGVALLSTSSGTDAMLDAVSRGASDEQGTDVLGNHDYGTVPDATAPRQAQKAVFEETYEGSLHASFTWKLRGKNVTLTDVQVQEISYVKRNSTELKSLRGEFNKTTRRAFLENLGYNAEYLRNAGFSETDIQKIQNGRVPNGWQVHHKLPLDDSGTNSFDNLVLIQNEPYHKVITNYQNGIARQMKIGDIQTVEWPMLNGKIYPAQH